jgi:hypothetical protein
MQTHPGPLPGQPGGLPNNPIGGNWWAPGQWANPGFGGGQPPAGQPAQPPQEQQQGMADQGAMLKAMKNWQDTRNTYSQLFDTDHGFGSYNNAVDTFGQNPDIMQGWAAGNRGNRFLSDF